MEEFLVTVFSVGQITVTRVEETYLPTYPATQIFPEWNDEINARHAHWLAPHHYEPNGGLIKLSVHSWLLRIGGRNILIDSCCGNNKLKPNRPFWTNLNTDYPERLAAAGARPDEIDMVMCTHLHHDHVGWNTQLRDGKWVPRFPNARYLFSKLDFDYFHKLDSDAATAPTEFGSFRECVVPVVEAGRADLVTGPHRLDEFIDIAPAGGHSPGHFVFNLNVGGNRATLIGDVLHHLLQVYYPDWNFPKNSDVEEARVSRRRVLDDCASTGALVFARHFGFPFAGHIEKIGSSFKPRF